MILKSDLRSVEEIARSPDILVHAARLTKINNGRAIWAITRQWVIIICFGSVAVLSDNVFLYVVAMCVIATRQHALAVLFHDASHFRLLSNRTANDLIANILCALPSGIVVARYRAEHLRHHRAPNTEFDPYA